MTRNAKLTRCVKCNWIGMRVRRDDEAPYGLCAKCGGVMRLSTIREDRNHDVAMRELEGGPK